VRRRLGLDPRSPDVAPSPSPGRLRPTRVLGLPLVVGSLLAAGSLLASGPLPGPAGAATAAATAAKAATTATTGGTATWSVDNPIPPRLQWNENNGYCGETAFISADLYYGQYLSQYDARAIASNDTPQYETDAQLLLGVNDQYAATQMRLTSSEWTPGTTSTTDDFLAWVKGEVIQGHPVAIGVYENEDLFYGTTKPDAGDPKYDHIVIVTGVTSHHPLTLPATYYPDDELKFSDNGLWTGTAGTKPQYLFDYPFHTFQATRQDANTPTGNVYSLPDAVRNYGIAITGVADPDHETVPVRVATSVNDETPQIAHHSNTRPAAMPLTLTVTVSGLHAGTSYDLYRFDDVTKVPTTAFAQHAGEASWKTQFTATATSYTLTQSVVSSDQVIYRAIPATTDVTAVAPAGGYREVGTDGGVFAFGDAGFYGSMAGQGLSQPIVGIASTPDDKGYWEVGADGGVFAFGDAGFYGSMAGQHLGGTIAGIVATPDGKGYWEVGSDGGVFAFGDAGFYGSMAGQGLSQPVVGIASTPDGTGYWEVGADGGVFAFGDAGFYGSMAGQGLSQPIVGIASSPDGHGYWEVGADGGVFAFGDAGFYGSMAGQSLGGTITGIASSPDGHGYWEVGADGGVFAFGDAGFYGSMAGQSLGGTITGIASTA
jgi:peptidase C39-like protein